MSAQKKPVKKTKCKIAGPMCKDRAEAFMGARAEVLPKFSEVPQERDKRAFELAAKGWTQRSIAKKLKISQPTVHRAIIKYRCWFGSTLPEDREKLYGWGRFRVAVEERRIFLQHQQELAMEEWHESRKPVAMKRTRMKVDPEGRKLDEMPITDMQVETWMQKRHASATHFNAANKRSLELTLLEGGYLGVNRISCDLAMDTDERDRWDRAAKNDKQTIAELQREVAELKAQVAAMTLLGAGLPTPPTGSTAGLPVGWAGDGTGDLRSGVSAGSETRAEPQRNQPEGNANPACISQSLMHPTPPLTASASESRTAPETPVSNQTSPDSQAGSPVAKALSGDEPDSRPVDLQGMNQMNKEPCRVHEAQRNARVDDSASVVNPPEPSANPACISQSLMHPTTATMLSEGLPTPPTGPTAGLPVGSVGDGAGDLRSGVSAGSETRAEPGGNPACISQSLMHPTTESPAPSASRRKPPTYVSVLGPGGRLMWLQKPKN